MIDDARGAIDGLQTQLEHVVPLIAGLMQDIHAMESQAETIELSLEERAQQARRSQQLAETAEINDALGRLRALRERLRYLQEVPLSLARSRELPPDLESVLRSEIAAN